MSQIVFTISFSSIVVILALSIFSMNSKKFEFFPPPSKDAWQYKVFWLLFRIMFVGIVFLSVMDFGALKYLSTTFRFFLGLPFLVVGFSAAFYLSVILGWKNAHGEQQTLVTTGCYRWSRNPIYVVSLFGIVGWGLLVDSLFVYILLALWGALYVLAPFAEEPWLEKRYGADYVNYKSVVPRFLGLPKIKR
ncbi:MAG: methyltransferase family protein [Gammaproteobacteria bacterium]